MTKWSRIGATLLAVLGVFLIGYGYAQTRANSFDSRTVLISVPCYKSAVALGAILKSQYGEVPIAESLSNMRWVDGKEEKEMFGIGMMFANADTKSYSNVILFQDGTACILGAGVDFKPIKFD